jgi:hypothetical protein
MLSTGPRVVVRYPNTNSFLMGTINQVNDKNIVKCDRGCSITFNKGSRNIIGSVGKEKNTEILSKIEAIESILKNLKPYMGNPLKKNKYEKGDRVVLIHEGGGNYSATVKHVSNTYIVAWDNPKYPDEEVDHETILGMAIDKKRSNQIPNKLLKDFLLQSGSKQTIKEEKPLKLGKTTVEIPLAIVKDEISDDEFTEVTNSKSDEIIRELNSFKKKADTKGISRKEKIEALQDQIKGTIELLANLNKELAELILEKEPIIKEKPIREKVIKEVVPPVEEADKPVKIVKTKIHEVPDTIPKDDMDEDDGDIVDGPKNKKIKVSKNETKEISELHQLLINESASDKIKDDGEIWGATYPQLLKMIKKLPIKVVETPRNTTIKDGDRIVVILRPSGGPHRDKRDNYIRWEYQNTMPEVVKDSVSSEDGQRDGENRKWDGNKKRSKLIENIKLRNRRKLEDD